MITSKFYIQSKIGLSDWVLTASTDRKSVHLAHRNVDDLNQHWQREDDPRGGFFLYNVGTGEVLQRTTSQGGRVELRERNNSDSNQLWRQETWGSWVGINTLVDWEQKLNVSGGRPYNETTPIILWEYSRGGENESWQFVPVPEIIPPDPKQGFYIQSKIGLSDWVLTASTDGKFVHLTQISKDIDLNQLWHKEDDPRGGFFLYNFGTRKVLQRTTSQGGQVELIERNNSDINQLWRQETWDSWIGINTLVDWEQKLNVSGGRPYNETTPIILWEYSRGGENESWRFVPAIGTISRGQVEQLIRTYGPILKLHPDEKYFMDDPDAVLASGKTQLQYGLVYNEDDFDSFKEGQVNSIPVSSASDLLSAVKVAKQDPNQTDPAFRYWLHIDDSQKPGNQPRAKALISVKQNNPAFVDLEFWFFYPFNGPGKFRLTVGNVKTDHVQMDTCGRHYGDWEHVTLRFGGLQPGSNSWQLVDVYLSRHDISTWIGNLSALQFRDHHPVIYVARDSHAHYPSAGSQYYKRVWSRDFFLGTAAVDLEDLTGDGQEFNTSEPGKYMIAASSVPEHGVQKPDWWSFEGRWGQYERLEFDYSIEDSGIHLYTYAYKEVEYGPMGPSR
jgi:hypothetical protein